jgi:hypothetical protein
LGIVIEFWRLLVAFLFGLYPLKTYSVDFFVSFFYLDFTYLKLIPATYGNVFVDFTNLKIILATYDGIFYGLYQPKLYSIFRYSTITEPLHCVYKFDYDKYSGTFNLEDDNSPVGEVNRHKFYGWHTATLILLFLALLTSFLSVCIGLCGCCYPSLALVLTVITLLTSEFFGFDMRVNISFL